MANQVFSSRKYKLALLSLLILITGWIISGYLPALQKTYSDLIGGVMGLLMLYYTGNVGNKFVVGRYLNQKLFEQNKQGDQSGNH